MTVRKTELGKKKVEEKRNKFGSQSSDVTPSVIPLALPPPSLTLPSISPYHPYPYQSKIRVFAHTKNGVRTDGRMDGRTDGRTDRRMDGQTD